jgi:Flp pilus assembly protein TadG
MRASKPSRRGNVIVMCAVSLVMIVAVTALSVDGGMLLDKRRTLQATTDAAALAAAGELYRNYPYYQGADTDGVARKAAFDACVQNGFEDGKNCAVTVNIPPATGQFVGKSAHVEVLITYQQPKFFARLFSSDAVPVGARSVARGREVSIKNAIITLNPTGKGSLNAAGNGSITVQGANIQVNSNSTEAMIANGNGFMQAQEFDVTGGSPGYTTPGGGSFVGPIVTYSPPIPDPLRFVPYPDPTKMVVRSTRKLQVSGGSIVLHPGLYIGGITITGKADVTLMPGIYYMQCGGFNYGGQGSMKAVGVMIFNSPCSSSDVINISGQGSVIMSPPTEGPYQGISIFQDRTSTNTVSIQGSADTIMSITGTFYVAGGLLSVTGNGDQQTIGSQYISYDLKLGGNGTYFCSWNPNLDPGKRELRLVE